VRHSQKNWRWQAAVLAVAVLMVAGIAFRFSGSRSLAQAGGAATHPPISATTLQMPLYFEPNRGQADPEVRFLARGTGYGLFFTADEAVLGLQHPMLAASSPKSAPILIRMHMDGANAARIQASQPLPGKSNYFIGNDPAKWQRNVPQFGRIEYQSVYPGIDLVYYGNDRQLEYDFRVAPGADPNQIALSFQGASARLDSGDLILATHDGDVRFHAPHVYQPAGPLPGVHRQNDIAGSFHLLAANKVGFSVGPYDHSRELVIDPTLSYSTYLGGAGTESLVKVAVDKANNIYLAGSTTAPIFPSTSIPGQQNIFIAVFNTSLPGASQLVYSNYLGSSGTDNLAGIAVDSGSNIYVAGTTISLGSTADFPTTSNAFQSTGTAGTHGFVSQLSFASGAYALNYSTYLAGNGADTVTGIAADNNGNAYVTGTTTSTNDQSNGFPSNDDGYQLCPFAPPQAGVGCVVSSGPPQFFASKLSTSAGLSGAATMLYSTYFGGASGTTTVGGGIAVDSSGYMYFTGATNMPNNTAGIVGPPNFPIYNATQPCLNQPGQTTCNTSPVNPSDTDAILVKLNPSQSEPSLPPFFSTYLGGSLNDAGTAVAVDSVDNAYVTGSTNSTDWDCLLPCTLGPTPSQNPPGPFGYNGVGGATNAFIAQITNQSQANTVFPLNYFAWLGGSGPDSGQAIAVDSLGTVHMAGNTSSPNLAINYNSLKDYLQTYQGNGDAFVALVTPSALTAGDYVTYLGGTGLDQGTGVAVDSVNNTYVAGTTISPPCSSCSPPNIVGFPITSNAYQPTLAGSNPNAFVSVIGNNSTIVVSKANGSPFPSPVNAGQAATFTFSLFNQGPDPATDIFFNAFIPTGYPVNPAANVLSGVGTCNNNFQIGQTSIPCEIFNLAAGATAQIQVVVTPPAPPPTPPPYPFSVSCNFSVNGGGFTNCPVSQQDTAVDFTISASPSTLTVQNGGLASFVITLTPDPTYDGTITMTQTPSKPIVTAGTPTFVNPTVTLDGTGQGTTTLNIQTVARPVNTGSLLRRTSPYAAWLPIGGLSLIGLGLGAGSKRRRWVACILLGLLLGLLLLQPACSSSSNSVSTNQGTAAGTYFITITGSSSTNASHTTLLTLNVT